MKILLTGSRGQLGCELLRINKPASWEVVATDIDDLDISNKVSAINFFENKKIDLVINAAAYTQVDKAESDVETAYKVNCEGPANLAQICNSKSIPLIHISTDYVFDGTTNRPYKEEDSCNPLNVYGRTKLEGELKVIQHCKKYLIFRTMWLFSPFGNNFLKTILRLAKEKETLRIVNDQYGSPTSAKALAAALVQIITLLEVKKEITWGLYHLACRGITTWYEFAKHIISRASRYAVLSVKEIIPISSAEYPLPAKRPLFSALDCSLVEKIFGVTMPTWQDCLAETVDELFLNLKNST